MADAMTLEAPAGVAEQKSTETGKSQASQASLPPLYQQLPKAEIARLEGLVKDGKLDVAKLPAKFDTLWGEYQRLQSEVGNAVRVPGKDATDEQRAAYRKAMGVPESPEGYSLTKPTLPNGLPYNDKLEKWFRQELFDAGVPNEAAQKIFNDWNTLQAQSFTEIVKARDASAAQAAKNAIDTLQAEYKDAYPKKMQSMSAAMARFMTPALLERIKSARTPQGITLDNDPEFMKAWVAIGDRMIEDEIAGGQSSTTAAGTKTPRPGLPKSPSGMPLDFYPEMEKSARMRVKAE